MLLIHSIPNMSIQQYYCLSFPQSALICNIDTFANLSLSMWSCYLSQSISTILCSLLASCDVFSGVCLKSMNVPEEKIEPLAMLSSKKSSWYVSWLLLNIMLYFVCIYFVCTCFFVDKDLSEIVYLETYTRENRYILSWYSNSLMTTTFYCLWFFCGL